MEFYFEMIFWNQKMYLMYNVSKSLKQILTIFNTFLPAFKYLSNVYIYYKI